MLVQPTRREDDGPSSPVGVEVRRAKDASREDDLGNGRQTQGRLTERTRTNLVGRRVVVCVDSRRKHFPSLGVTLPPELEPRANLVSNPARQYKDR